MKKIVSLSLILGLCGVSFLFANDDPCPPIMAGETGTAGNCMDVIVVHPDGNSIQKECVVDFPGLPGNCWAS